MKTKKTLDSLTIRGLLVVIIGMILQWCGVADVSDEKIGEFAASILSTIPQLMEIGGVVVAWIGRARAKGPLVQFKMLPVLFLLMCLGGWNHAQ